MVSKNLHILKKIVCSNQQWLRNFVLHRQVVAIVRVSAVLNKKKTVLVAVLVRERISNVPKNANVVLARILARIG